MEKRETSKTLAVIAFVVLLLNSLITSSFSDTTIPTNIATLLLSSALFSIMLGTVFIFSKNETLKKVGYGILAIIAFVNLGSIFSNGTSFTSIANILDLIATVLLIISVSFFFVSAVLEYFGYKSILTVGSKVSDLKSWKKFADNHKISAEDYAMIKDLLLKNPSNSPVGKDLHEFKELMANDLIDSSDLAKFRDSL